MQYYVGRQPFSGLYLGSKAKFPKSPTYFDPVFSYKCFKNFKITLYRQLASLGRQLISGKQKLKRADSLSCTYPLQTGMTNLFLTLGSNKTLTLGRSEHNSLIPPSHTHTLMYPSSNSYSYSRLISEKTKKLLKF